MPQTMPQKAILRAAESLHAIRGLTGTQGNASSETRLKCVLEAIAKKPLFFSGLQFRMILNLMLQRTIWSDFSPIFPSPITHWHPSVSWLRIGTLASVGYASAPQRQLLRVEEYALALKLRLP